MITNVLFTIFIYKSVSLLSMAAKANSRSNDKSSSIKGATKVRIALIQMSMSVDPRKNVRKAASMIASAAKKGAKIICLPELFNTLYFPQKEGGDARKYAELIPGPATDAMSRLAKDLKVVIIVPLYEVTKEHNYFNTAVIIDENGNILDTYRKIHIPHDPLFYERNYFQEGDQGFKVIHTTYADIAPLICFDQWFPEAARTIALRGADIIFYPTAIGWIKGYHEKDDWHDAWETIQRSHSIANGIYVASVNRVGVEGKLDFWGASFVSDPFGKILSKASDKKEEIVIADIDLAENERIRQGWGFFIKRRPDAYGLLEDKSKKAAIVPQKKSPAALGYYMPAEWHPHQAIFLAWPHDKITFPKLANVEKAYINILKAMAQTNSEDINLLVTGPKMRKKVESLIMQNKINQEKVHIYEHDYADVWFRDYGPTFVINPKEKKIAMVKWTFNSWGNKYKELLKDDDIPQFLNKFFNLPYFDSGIVMEGGSLEVNGKGTLLTTTKCLLNKNRNPNLSQKEIESVLKSHLNIKNIVWLHDGILGDDTDAHIDNLARFVNESTIVCAFEEDAIDPNYKNLKENYDILTRAKDQDGKPFKIVKLPVPKLKSGKRILPASYCNFYIANNTVLVPQFGLTADAYALGILRKLFPKKKCIGILCNDVVFGSGTLHCISQQMPKV